MRSSPHTTSLFLSLLAMVTIGLAFGLVMAIVSNYFVLGVEWLSSLRESSNFLRFHIFGLSLSLMPLLCLTVAAFVIMIIRNVLNIQRWHGPADSIYAAHRTDNELDLKHGFGSTIAAFVSAGGGASVGQYGPLVHFGATMGSLFRQITKSNVTTDIFIGCGVAGAIAAGFNAPIAGVVFAHEAILRHFSLRAIAPIAISSISAAWLSKWIFNSDPLFPVLQQTPNLIELLPAAMISGVAFGLVAVIFMETLRRSAAFAKDSGLSPNSLVLIAGLITGLVGAFVPEILGLGSSATSALIQGFFKDGYLVALLFLKILLTSICIGFGMFGGVFSPAIFVGAATGAILSRILEISGLVFLGPGLVICGMAAVASAVIGAPIAGVLIILEMTMSYEYALAAMLSVVVSIMLSNLIFGHSFFDRQLNDRGIDISLGRGHIEMMETPILNLASDEYVGVGASTKIEDAVKKLVASGMTEGYVLEENERVYLGKISLNELIGKDNQASVHDHMMVDPITIKDDASLQQSIEVASNFVGESIPVINRQKGMLVGVITEADLFKEYLSLQNKVVDLEKG